MEGLRFGLAVGVLVHLSAAFEQFATMDIALGSIFGDRLWHIVETAAGGITIALIHGRPSAATKRGQGDKFDLNRIHLLRWGDAGGESAPRVRLLRREAENKDVLVGENVRTVNQGISCLGKF